MDFDEDDVEDFANERKDGIIREEMSLVNFDKKRKQEHLLQLLNFNTKPLFELRHKMRVETIHFF